MSLLLTGAVACRKQVLRDLDYMTKPAHCYNQELDGCELYLRSCNTGFNYQFSGTIGVKIFVDVKWFL